LKLVQDIEPIGSLKNHMRIIPEGVSMHIVCNCIDCNNAARHEIILKAMFECAAKISKQHSKSHLEPHLDFANDMDWLWEFVMKRITYKVYSIILETNDSKQIMHCKQWYGLQGQSKR
jgi:hypothetical protein